MIAAAFVALSLTTSALAQGMPLSPLEAAQGFKILSGPDAKEQWREYKKTSFPAAGWDFKDGVFHHVDGGGGGDIITKDQFKNFELELQFKTGKAANSGIIYHIAESKDYCWMTGPEYQLLEDVGANEKPDGLHSCAALYDIMGAPATKQLKPADEWNDARITFRNGVVQHWLNGEKVVELRFFDDEGKPTEDWLKRIAGSKFKEWPGFGLEPKGHIALQEHPGDVSFRNIKVRDLDAPMPGEKILFDGSSLAGWTPVVPALEGKTPGPESVWSTKDGVLICHGSTDGYLRTNDEYDNYILRLEWRFNPETKAAGNSGLLLNVVGPDAKPGDTKIWPKCIEAQLLSGDAGNLYAMGGAKMSGDPARSKGRGTRHTHAAERAVGEWNDYEIIMNHGNITVRINGEEVNRAAGLEQVAGHIALQSEGTEIQFRNIRLVPLH